MIKYPYFGLTWLAKSTSNLCSFPGCVRHTEGNQGQEVETELGKLPVHRLNLSLMRRDLDGV